MSDRLFTADEVQQMIGDRMPGGSVPAAWWVSNNSDQLAAYDRYQQDRDEQHQRLTALAKRLGVWPEEKGATYARYSSGFGQAHLIGFVPTREMRLWKGHPDHQPPPQGWRVDAKSELLVPSRRTKADRESSANADFQSVAKIPTPSQYLSGISKELFLDDRADLGGTYYATNFRRCESCLIAVLGGDPDRAERGQRREFSWDPDVWDRRRLSEFLIARERAEAAA